MSDTQNFQVPLIYNKVQAQDSDMIEDNYPVHDESHFEG